MPEFSLVVATGAKLTRFGEVPRYAEGLYALGHDIYAWMAPNGSWGESNAGLISGQDESLLIDTFWDLKHTAAMLEAMKTVTAAAPIRRLVNTHADGDHFWGNQLVESVEIIATKECRQEMRNMKPGAMKSFGLLGKTLEKIALFGAEGVGRWFAGMTMPYDYTGIKLTLPTRVFSGEMTLTVGSREIRLIETGPAHTGSDLLVYAPDCGTLFAGDILFIDSTPVIWAGPLENVFAALDKIIALDPRLIVPGHGFLTDAKGVKQVRAYWDYIGENVQKRFRAGLSARQAAFDIALKGDFDRQTFAKWNSPERIVTNTYTIYRDLQSRAGRLTTPELLRIMWDQALLAQQLPDAQPAIMRRKS